MIIDVDLTNFDEIFKAILIDDWKKVKGEIKALKSRDQTSEYVRKELKCQKKLKKSYENVIRYVLSETEANDLIGKKKEKCCV